MVSWVGEEFARGVMAQYESRNSRTIELSHSGGRHVVGKSLQGAGTVESGHPAFIDLQLNERRATSLTTVFLDLSEFTRRSFWDAPDDVAALGDACLTGFTSIVTSFGGFVLGLRGDGLFAGFDAVPDAGAGAGFALSACAVALDSVEHSLNPRLVARGDAPVQARAGVDFGDVVFVRSGTVDVNEVNVIGHSANFAAKCEKTAKSWEVVAGQGVASCLPGNPLLTPHSESPKKYERGWERRYYDFYDYAWRRVLPEAVAALDELAGRSLAELPRLR